MKITQEAVVVMAFNKHATHATPHTSRRPPTNITIIVFNIRFSPVAHDHATTTTTPDHHLIQRPTCRYNVTDTDNLHVTRGT